MSDGGELYLLTRVPQEKFQRALLGTMRRMDGQPVTHAELVEALARQERKILEGVQEIVRDSQTEILKAFLPYNEGTNLRMRQLENAGGSIFERMAVLERRLQEIEKRLLMNPPAA